MQRYLTFSCIRRNNCRLITYVSSHYKANTTELRQLIDSMKTEVKECNGGIDLKVCNLCSKGNKHNIDNLWKLRIFENGNFICFRCSVKGNWFDLKKRANGNH